MAIWNPTSEIIEKKNKFNIENKLLEISDA